MMIYSRYALILSLLLLVSCSDSLVTSPEAPPGLFEGSNEVTPAESHSARGVLNFAAPMDPGQEVHMEVVSNATGLATFQHRPGSGEIHYRVNVANIENVTMSHIHLGAQGDEGPVVAWLYPEMPPPQLIEGRTQGTLAQGVIASDDLVGPLEEEELDDLLALMEAGEIYVNVHTEQYPPGEIRGQIDRGNGITR